MANILFWNINRKPLLKEIASLCHDNEVDILVLAECDIVITKLLECLNNNGRRQVYLSPFNPSSRLSFIIRYPASSIVPVSDEGGIAIRKISPPIGPEFLLVALHLPSKLYMSENEQIFQTVRVSQAIQEAEARAGHTKTLVIGDLNMNPFEVGMVGADGLHAIMDRKIALKKYRKVQGKSRLFFYNPMWGRMGDTSLGPPGTYYYNDSGHINYYWNTFDQVLMRPDLLEFFSEENLKVITSIREKNLISENGVDTSISDHLPIMISLQLEWSI